MSNLVSRFVSTCLMVALLGALLLLGEKVLILSLYAIQLQVFQELQALSLFIQPAKGKTYHHYLDWSLFTIWSIWILGETLFSSHLVWLRLFSFLAYVLWFVLSVIHFNAADLLTQLCQFCWNHVINLYTVSQVYILHLNLNQGLYWFLLPASLVICNDISAYICGRGFGRRKLLWLSPNKTLEGYLGACAVTILFGYAFSVWLAQFDYLFIRNAPPFIEWRSKPQDDWVCYHRQDHMEYHGIVLAVYASLVAPFGGYFASALKRAKGIKDFSRIIPGHGGLTDRVDCQLLMGLFTLIYIQCVAT